MFDVDAQEASAQDADDHDADDQEADDQEAEDQEADDHEADDQEADDHEALSHEEFAAAAFAQLAESKMVRPVLWSTTRNWLSSMFALDCLVGAGGGPPPHRHLAKRRALHDHRGKHQLHCGRGDATGLGRRVRLRPARHGPLLSKRGHAAGEDDRLLHPCRDGGLDLTRFR